MLFMLFMVCMLVAMLLAQCAATALTSSRRECRRACCRAVPPGAMASEEYQIPESGGRPSFVGDMYRFLLGVLWGYD